ncbi:MAG: DNA polymerase [Synergistaceae bacterium]|nr:DNA polymerase [Synergistaceae bacterium]
MSANDRILIVDGHGLAFRAFYAVPPLNAPDGTPTNAVLGFMNMLSKVEDEVSPSSCLVAFDAPGPTFRHELYREYKAQRKPTPEEFKPQIAILMELLASFGYQVVSPGGVEADDVMASAALAAAKSGKDVLMVCSDKDLFQVLGPGIRILRPVKGITTLKTYDEASFSEEYGFPPKSMADYLALLGDASDNVPGVPGIGEKTALQLIREYETIECLYEAMSKGKPAAMRPALARKLAAGEESALQSLELTRLKLDLSVELGEARPDFDNALALCKRLGMTKLAERVKKLFLPAEAAPASVEPEFGTVTQVEAESLLDSDELAVMLIHSNSKKYPPDAGGSELHIADANGRYAVLCGLGLTSGLWNRLAGNGLAGRKKLFVNDYKELLACIGEPRIFEKCEVWDLKTAHYLLHPDASSHAIESIYPQEGDRLPVLSLWRAARELSLELRRYHRLPELMTQVDLPLIPVLVEMERGGIRLSAKSFIGLQRELEECLAAIDKKICEAAGEEINLNSPKQVEWLLFERLGLPSGAKTKGKTGYSTSASVLESLAESDLPNSEVPRLMLEHRELSKMLSGFVVPLQKSANAGGGVVRTTFEAALTGTGRLSSRAPNLQNLPAFGQWSRRIKEGLIPSAPGRIFVAADYSQIELRILAHFSGEERLRDAFQNGGRDIHRETASWVFATPPEDVTPELRRVAKMINFGLLYGMSPFGLADRLGISRNEAGGIINRYFAALPGVKRYLEESAEEAQSRGYTQTFFGRIRPIAEAMNGTRDRNGLKRVAINTPIQGTAADIARKAMIEFGRVFASDGGVRLLLQIHDSLVCECPEERAEEVGNTLAGVMMSAAALTVPLEVELKTGRTLADV